VGEIVAPTMAEAAAAVRARTGFGAVLVRPATKRFRRGTRKADAARIIMSRRQDPWSVFINGMEMMQVLVRGDGSIQEYRT
jgi:hypothetical protein